MFFSLKRDFEQYFTSHFLRIVTTFYTKGKIEEGRGAEP